MNSRFSTLVLAALVAAGPAVADGEGAQIYQRYCAACHGLAATGNGPMAPNLILQPPDLTRLAAANGGVFPVFDVVSRIDGREPLVAHGSPMPVFGELFDTRGAIIRSEDGQPIQTSEPIADLVHWLEEIQQPAEPNQDD